MRIFSPKRYVASVDRIDLDTLWADGKRAILLDRDNTLVPRDTEQVPAAVSAWLDTARAKGFKLCMVSNNWHRDQVMASARELGLEAISHAMKPAPFALKAGLKRLGATADEAVLIGDQLLHGRVERQLRRRRYHPGKAAGHAGPVVYADLPYL